jgi:hypothetical protein
MTQPKNKKKFYILAYNIDEDGRELKSETIGPFVNNDEIKECIESRLLDSDEVTHAEIVSVTRRIAFRSIRKAFEDEF